MSAAAAPRLAHRVEAAALRLVSLPLGPLGWRRTQRLGAAIGAFAYHVVGIRKDVSRANIARAFPGRSGPEIDAAALAAYRAWGSTFFEVARIGAMSPGEVRLLVRFDPPGLLGDVLAGGKGAILFTGHYGNFDLFGGAISAHGYPLSVLVQRQSNVLVDERMRVYRERMGSKVIYRGANVREVVRELRAGRFVAIVGDQDAGAAGVFVDFLGAPASTPKGAALLAYRFDVPIVFGVLERNADGTHVGRMEGPIRANRAAGEDAEVFRLTQELARRLEAAVRRRPDHYFWMHRRWKTKPPAAGDRP